MKLHRSAREFYTLVIVTTPAVTSWEASFDGGRTWTVGEPTAAGTYRWLVAGPDADAHPSEVTVRVPGGCGTPLVRATDDPEVLVRYAPPIVIV